MSKVLTPESVATRPDASCFSSERLALLKRIFDSFCKEENIVSEEQRDELAANLLEASKFSRRRKNAYCRHDVRYCWKSKVGKPRQAQHKKPRYLSAAGKVEAFPMLLSE